MKQDPILIFLMTVMIIGAGYGVYTTYQIQDNWMESACHLGLLKAGLSIYEDIERLEEHKLLCSNLGCEVGIQDKINKKQASLKRLAEGTLCEEFK